MPRPLAVLVCFVLTSPLMIWRVRTLLEEEERSVRKAVVRAWREYHG
jgi:hypothetical protein